MTRNHKEISVNEPIFIGKIIEEELRRQERSVTWLSRKLHCDRRNIYDIFSRPRIDTDLLYRICLALNTDFFAYYSANLHLINNHPITPPNTQSRINLSMVIPARKTRFIIFLEPVSQSLGMTQGSASKKDSDIGENFISQF